MPFGIGQWEILILAAVLILVFGTSKVPRIARELGLGLREMKKTMDDVDPRKPLKEFKEPLDELDPRKSFEEPDEPEAGEKAAGREATTAKRPQNGAKASQSRPRDS